MKKIILLTSIAALTAVGTANAGPVAGYTRDGVPANATPLHSNIVASKYYVDRLAVEIADEVDTLHTRNGTMEWTTGSTSDLNLTDGTDLTTAIKAIRTAVTLSDGIATEINANNEINVLHDSDRRLKHDTNTNQLYVDTTGLQGTLTPGIAIDFSGSDSDTVDVKVLNNSDNAIQIISDSLFVDATLFQNTLTASDGIDITSDVITAVGNANKAVIVESDGIGVIKKSDGAISVASDGVGVKVNNTASAIGGAITIVNDQLNVMVDGTSVKVNNAGQLSVDATQIVTAGDNIFISDGEINAITDSDCDNVLAAHPLALTYAVPGTVAAVAGTGHCTVSLASDGKTFKTEIVIH